MPLQIERQNAKGSQKRKSDEVFHCGWEVQKAGACSTHEPTCDGSTFPQHRGKNEVPSFTEKGIDLSIYKLYGSGVTDALASLDVVANGVIEGIQWAAVGDLDADGESFNAEVSFSSTSGFTSNDTKSSISTIRQLAAGTPVAYCGVNQYFGPNLGIPVKAGERLYLHASGTAFIGTVYLYVRDGIGEGRTAGRRVRL